MKPRRLTKFLLLFLIAINYSKAQSDQLMEDSGVIHFDKPFYTSGEIAWFSIYFPSTLNYDNSLARITIVNSASRLMNSFYLKIESARTAQGYFKIPYEWMTDQYHFLVDVTNDYDNEHLIIISHGISIYNDLAMPAIGLTVMDSAMSPLEDNLIHLKALQSEEKGVKIEITPSQNIYETRGEVSIKLKVLDENGNPLNANLSVSVTDYALIGKNVQEKTYSIGETIPKMDSFIVDEDISIRGRAEFNGARLASKGIGAFFQETGYFEFSDTDNDGVFMFDFYPFEGVRHFQVQSLSEKNLEVNLLDEKDIEKFIQFRSNSNEKKVKSYLELSRRRKIIQQIYNEDEILVTPPPKVVKYNLKADWVIRIDEFEPFRNFEDFLKNVGLPLKLRKKGGEYELKMVNPDKKPFYDDNPLLIVDNTIVNNPNYILSLDISKVDRFELFYQKSTLDKYFDYFGRSGVVMVYTKENSMRLQNVYKKDIFEINGIQTAFEFPSIRINSESENTPYFRPTVYWNPSLKIEGQSESVITFYHSDDPGVFSVEVIGKTQNGDLVIGTSFYEVK